MTNRTIIASLCVLLCLATVSSSCKKGCGTCRSYGFNTTINAYTAQTCYNNFCTCPNGYEGDSCQIYSFKKYVTPSQTWAATDACSGSSTYYVSISTSVSYPLTVLYINGLFNGGSLVEADILSSANNTSTTLNIIPTTTPTGTINSGIGYYTQNGAVGKITLNLDFTNNAGLDVPCTVYLYQQ